MRVLEGTYLILIAGLVIGVPVAATSQPVGSPFSWSVAIQQGGTLAGILLALLLVTMAAGRFLSRKKVD